MVENTTPKHGISEAAAEVLAASIRNSGSDSFGLGKKMNPAGIEIPTMDLGPTHYRGDEKFVDYTRGVPHATPPGQTPPVGSEPMHKLAPQPQQTKGFGDNSDPQKGPNPNLDAISRRQTNVTAKISTGKGNVPPPWAHEEVETLATAITESLKELDEVAFRYRKQKKAEIAKNREASEKKDVIRKYKSNDSTKAKVRKVKEAVVTELELDEEDIVDLLDELYGEPMQTWKDKVEDILNTTTGNLSEDVDAIFNGETLSEEFKTRATTIFETAVASRVRTIGEQLETLALTQLDESVEEIKEELTNKVDDYLNYMVEEWLKENEIAIEKGLKSEIVEDFITGLRSLFIEHYIDIPEEKVDLVSELTDKVDELTESLNNEIAKGIAMRKALGEAMKTEALDAVCEGLVQTQVEKLKTLAASVEFTTESEYKEKLETLRESYFPTKVVKSPSTDHLNDNQLITEDDDGKPKVTDPLMRNLVDTIARTSR